MLVGLESSSQQGCFFLNPVPTQGEPPKSINMVLCTRFQKAHTQRDHRPIPTVDSASPRRQRGSSASLAQKSPSISLSCQILIFLACLSSSCCAFFFFFLAFLFSCLASSVSCSLRVSSFSCLLSCYEETQRQPSANLALPCCITIFCWGPASKRKLKNTSTALKVYVYHRLSIFFEQGFLSAVHVLFSNH